MRKNVAEMRAGAPAASSRARSAPRLALLSYLPAASIGKEWRRHWIDSGTDQFAITEGET